MTVPIVLSLADDGDLLLEPVPELETLRQGHEHFSDIKITQEGMIPLNEVSGDRIEIRAVFEWKDVEEFGLKVRCSPEGEEQTQIRFYANPWRSQDPPQERRPTRQLILDTTRSSTNTEVCSRESQRASFDLPYGELVELRVFVDRSVVEVFANGRYYLAKRIYPLRDDSMGIQVFANGGNAILRSLDAWAMEPIWPIK